MADPPFRYRYEKTLRNYVAVVAIGCALLWLVSDSILAALGELDQHGHDSNNRCFPSPVSALFQQLLARSFGEVQHDR